MKGFPAGRPVILLPFGDRRAAALGISLFTASRPLVVRAQQAAFILTKRLGVRALPGRSRPWSPPFESDRWELILEQWRTSLGEFDAYAIYQRRQTSREGLTVLLTHAGAPVAVVKVREDGHTLEKEQRALKAARAAQTRYFQVPEPLGMTWLPNGGAWSAQAAVFDAPHQPVFDAPSLLFDEIREALRPVVPITGTEVPAHNDMTPWNLRRDRRGQIWLFDWEDVGPAPVGFDRTYFWATSYATRQCAMPDDLPQSGVTRCRDVTTARRDDLTTDPADAATARRMLAGLDRVRKSRTDESLAEEERR